MKCSCQRIICPPQLAAVGTVCFRKFASLRVSAVALLTSPTVLQVVATSFVPPLRFHVLPLSDKAVIILIYGRFRLVVLFYARCVHSAISSRWLPYIQQWLTRASGRMCLMHCPLYVFSSVSNLWYRLQ